MKLELEPIDDDDIQSNQHKPLNNQARSHTSTMNVAQNEAEILYQQGMQLLKDTSDPTNARKSYDFFKKSAQMQHPLSQSNLGLLYAEGHGVDYDPEKAVYWYKKSAEQGFDVGMVNLAKMLLKGEGIKKNTQEAKEWILKAYEQGNEEASELLAYVAEDDTKLGFKGGLIVFIVMLSIIPCVMMTYPVLASIFSSLGMESVGVIPAALLSMMPSLILWGVLNAIFLNHNG